MQETEPANDGGLSAISIDMIEILAVKLLRDFVLSFHAFAVIEI
jgi:hypothetical protein